MVVVVPVSLPLPVVLVVLVVLAVLALLAVLKVLALLAVLAVVVMLGVLVGDGGCPSAGFPPKTLGGLPKKKKTVRSFRLPWLWRT